MSSFFLLEITEGNWEATGTRTHGNEPGDIKSWNNPSTSPKPCREMEVAIQPSLNTGSAVEARKCKLEMKF